MVSLKKSNINFDDFKEKSILQRIIAPKSALSKPILRCEPDEVILQNIEKNKMYEVPIKIYNQSLTSKRVIIRCPKTNYFKVDYDRKNKNTQIVPGLYLELLVIFETDSITEDKFDTVEISSENDFKIVIELRALIPKAIVHFEPFVNFGFVSLNTKKVETILFTNDGLVDTIIDIKYDNKNNELLIVPDRFELLKNVKENLDRNKIKVKISYEPSEANNLNEKIDILQIIDQKVVGILGTLEIIATSVVQQISVVFEEGGGPETEIKFGKLYRGQGKECSAYLVNNGPKEVNFKFFFHPNLQSKDVNLDDSDFVCTPQEAGMQMTQRILSASPLTGSIKPYTQIPMTFMCKTKLPKTEKGWRNNILEEFEQITGKKKEMTTKMKLDSLKSKTYISTAAIKFNDGDKLSKNERICNAISIFMAVTGVLPHISLDKTMVNFWECKLKEKKYVDIKINNKNEELPVDFVFNKVKLFKWKIPHFTVEPKCGIILPLGFISIKITFHPASFGRFEDNLLLKYVDKFYEIPIKVMGTCNVIGNKDSKVRGPEATMVDFNTIATKVQDDDALNYTIPRKIKIDVEATKKKKLFDDRIKELSRNTQNKEVLQNFNDKYQKYSLISLNKHKYNTELKNFRLDRTRTKNQKMNVIDNLVIGDKYETVNKKSLLDLLIHDQDNIIEPPLLTLPNMNEKLWIEKTIGNLEPENFDEILENKKYVFDENMLANDKNVIEYPSSHTEKRDCELELDGKALKRIAVGPRSIDFGAIFKNSEQVKTFWIRNNLKTIIFIKIENINELRKTKFLSKVIYPGQTDGFNLILYSSENKIFSKNLKYFINGKHSFNLPIKANIVPVYLKFDPLHKFFFKNEKIQENKVEMTVSQSLFFKNEGNAMAHFSFDEPKNSKLWTISPLRGTVEKKQNTEVIITFTPIEGVYRGDQKEEFKCNIDYGDPIYLEVCGNVPEAKCSLVNDEINFGNVHVGVEESKEFIIKNDYKNKTAYKIDHSLVKEFLYFKEISGYIDMTKKCVTAVIKSQTPMPNFNEKVDIYIRGGNKITLSLKANIMIPSVYIIQESIDFGEVTFGGEAIRLITVKNDSKLVAKVIFNLNNHPDLKDFKIQIHSRYNGKNSHFILNLDKEEKQDDTSVNSEVEEDESDDDEDLKDIRHFQVELQPNSELDFEYIFKPDNSHASEREYNFTPEFELKGVKNIQGLQRKIKARLVKSKIFLSKEKVAFPKTFIYGGTRNIINKLDDKNFSYEEIKISNDTLLPIKWMIDIRDIEKENVFEVKDKSGILLENRDNALCCIKIKFQPEKKKKYEEKIYLNIYDEGQKKFIEYKSISLFGEGTHPRIFFDRRQIIMPIVPLNIESKVQFKIKNDGYESAKLSHRFLSEMGNIPLTLEYLDDRTIGILKSELTMELSFKSAKPVSFTCKLVLFDEINNEFSIFICGTADNCVFTNYSFLQRNYYNSDIVDTEGSLNVVLMDNENLAPQDDDEKPDISVSHLSSVITKNYILAGLPKVNKKAQQNSCKYLKRYINLICNSSHIKTFPEDLMKDNGEILFDIIYVLTGKNAPRLSKSDFDNKDNVIKNLRKMYDELIKHLQMEGAFLNTIYPEYLLDWPQYQRFINVDDLDNSKRLLAPDWQNKKKNQMKKLWNYYNKESWILLIYQILKIYYLSRINLKSLRATLKVMPDSETQKYAGNIKFPSSNLYSTNELILIKWMQILFDSKSTNQLKIKDFAKDLSDLSVLSLIIFTYFPKIEEKLKIPKKKNTQDGNVGVGLKFEKFLDYIKSYGIYTHIKAKHFSSLNPKEMVLFIVILFQNLVHFIPKDTINFVCILGETVTKTINLENSNPNRTIEYFIKKEGSDDFTTPVASEIKLENIPYDFPIVFKSKISTPVEGKLYFINKNEGFNLQAAPLVFNLTSTITGRKSIMPIISVTSPMYKERKFKLTVKSPIKERAEFDIKLQIIKKVPVIKAKTIRLVKPVNHMKKKEEEIICKVFYIDIDLDKDFKYSERFEFEKPKDIIINFLPVDMDTYECNVIFINEKIGEFQYTIEGKGELPEVQKVINQTCIVEEICEIGIDIEQQNKLFVDALNKIRFEHKLESKNSKKKLPISKDKILFNCETTKTFFNIANQFALMIEKDSSMMTIKEKSGDSKNNDASPMNTLNNNKSNLFIVKFSSKLCQVFEGDIIMRNVDVKSDIRIYRIKITVVPRNIKATLEFTCPLYEKIIQKIPIFNNSEKDWIIKAELVQEGGGGFFSGPTEKKILKRLNDFYQLMFYPKEKSGDINGRLILNNLQTQEQYEYRLIGRIDDPLAEGSIEIQCNAKECIKKIIELKNTSEYEKTFTVETDMPDVISGITNFTVKSDEIFKYEITVKPILGKVYFGKITFLDQKKNTIWYTIKIEARSQFINLNSPIEMKTYIRKAIFIEILLENPTNEAIIFNIEYEGEFLFGNKEFKLEGNKSSNYQLYYSPLKVGKRDGMIHIYNENIGEFLYKLSLICEENPAIYPDIMRAELGRSIELIIILENPLDEEIDIFFLNSNVINFSVIPDKILIPAFNKTKVQIKYTPSSIDYEEDAIITFENPKVGKWEYHLAGKGIPPTIMENTIVSTYVGGMTSGIINFKNPFKDYLNVYLELRNEGTSNPFKLMLKKDKYSIQPFRVLQIPFSFNPESLSKYYADVYVYIASSKSIFWKFPIEGVTEVKSKDIDFIFKTKAKKQYDKEIKLELTSLPIDGRNEIFTFSFNTKEEKYKTLVDKCLSAELQSNMLTPESNKLSLRVKFYPLRPFKTECEFIISKRSGGNWIFNVILESSDPDPDDVIIIQSSLGKKSSISFKLNNIFTKNSKFVAYFSHNSTAEFSVEPREGYLDQSGKNGTTFIVGYLPEEYGKIKIGKLIIETDEIQWIFEVRGDHIDYKPPEIKNSNIHKMTRTTMNRFNDREKYETIRNKVKLMDRKAKSKSRSRSRSRSRSKE